jgi:hypothetical protein
MYIGNILMLNKVNYSSAEFSIVQCVGGGSGAELHAFPTSAFHATSSSFCHFIVSLYSRLLGGPSVVQWYSKNLSSLSGMKPTSSSLQPVSHLLTALFQQFD